MKSEVYVIVVTSEEDFRNRVMAVANKVRELLSFKVPIKAVRKRVPACVGKNGGQFENTP